MTPAGEMLAAEIRRDGPIPFRRFMEVALYHPEHGYYRRPRDPFGKHGDFFTAEQLQPVFGILIAARIRQLFREMGEPAGLHRRRARRRPRRDAPTRSPNGATSLSISIPARCPRDFTGVVFSNEFFDALPVEVAVYDGARVPRATRRLSATAAFAWQSAAIRPSRSRRLFAPLLSSARSGPLV